MLHPRFLRAVLHLDTRHTGLRGGTSVGIVIFRSSSRFQPVQTAQQPLDVGREVFARNVLRRPSQGRADAREKVNVLDLGSMFGLAHHLRNAAIAPRFPRICKDHACVIAGPQTSGHDWQESGRLG